MKNIQYIQKEFIAKFLADISKTIFGVGLAGSFFISSPIWLCTTLWLVFFFFAIISIILVRKGEPK
ncbi:MAG: hypothetical protein HY586_00180 [Candidatus Omnitrophica bacterium]|nr:hypothetical protein [Candidatus Omnitrophota bacterium]